MAHELEVIDGRAQFLGREDAWHRLSALPENAAMGRNFSWDDVRENVPGLVLPVKKVALKDLIVDPTLKIPDDLNVTMREDGQVLGTVGARYTVIQAEEAFNLGEALRDAGDAPLETAGSIRQGRQFFFTYSLGAMDINGEVIENKISMVGSHDGSLANKAIRSHIAIVCANTLAMALRGHTHSFTFRHTSGYKSKIEEARRVLELAHKANEAFGQVVGALQMVKLETRKFDLLLDGLFPVQDVAAKTENEHKRARDAVRALFKSPMTAAFAGTGWAAVQAVNSYEQWNAPIRKAKGVGTDTTRAMRQFDAMVLGKQPLTERAVELVVAGV